MRCNLYFKIGSKGHQIGKPKPKESFWRDGKPPCDPVIQCPGDIEVFTYPYEGHRYNFDGINIEYRCNHCHKVIAPKLIAELGLPVDKDELEKWMGKMLNAEPRAEKDGEE